MICVLAGVETLAEDDEDAIVSNPAFIDNDYDATQADAVDMYLNIDPAFKSGGVGLTDNVQVERTNPLYQVRFVKQFCTMKVKTCSS